MSTEVRSNSGSPAGRTPAWAGLALALLAAAGACGVIRATHPAFAVPEEYHIPNMGAPIEKINALLAQQAKVDRWNAIVVLAVVGAFLGAAIGVATRPGPAAVLRFIAGALWGAVWGAGAGYVGALAHARLLPRDAQPTVTDTALVQAILFAALGAGMGLLAGLLRPSPQRLAVGCISGIFAGGLGGGAYPIIASVVMASASTDSLIPGTTGLTLLWLACGCGAIGLLLPLILDDTARRAEPADAKCKETEVQRETVAD